MLLMFFRVLQSFIEKVDFFLRPVEKAVFLKILVYAKLLIHNLALNLVAVNRVFLP